MKHIEFETKTGTENMQKDSDLLDFAISKQLKEPILRLYAWSPACVSLGRNQNEDFLDLEFLKSKNIDTVRRLTGGRALLHDKELTYSYICPIESLQAGESVIGSYKEISEFLIIALRKLNINLEFGHKKPHTKFDYCMSISTGADLSFEGKKLIGSAQFRKEGYILQHGSILFEYDKELIKKIFDEEIEEENITCLKHIAPELTLNELIDAIFETTKPKISVS